MTSYNVEKKFQNTEPKKVLCIDEIASVISDYFPDLWKLGQNYFVGDLAIKPDCSHETDFKVCFTDCYLNNKCIFYISFVFFRK